VYLALPFSWTSLYFASASFAVASLVFAICCPRLITRFASFSEYYQNGCGAIPLSNYITGIRERLVKAPTEKRDFDQAWNSSFRASGISDPVGDIDHSLTNEQTFAYHVSTGLPLVKREEMGDLFHVVHLAYDQSLPAVRLILGTLYLVGFLLILRISLENFLDVASVVWR
jgi:hypothetical protein